MAFPVDDDVREGSVDEDVAGWHVTEVDVGDDRHVEAPQRTEDRVVLCQTGSFRRTGPADEHR